MKHFFMGIPVLAGLLSVAGLSHGQNIMDNGHIQNTPIPVSPSYLGPCNSLATTSAGGNGQDGTMFSVRAKGDIFIERLTTNVVGAGNVSIYYKMGDYVGFEGTASAWTFVDSAFVTATGTDTEIPITLHIPVDSNEIISFYVTGTGSGASIDYTDGTTQGAVFSQDSFLEIREGAGMQYPFVFISQPRVFNGSVEYCPNIDYCHDLETYNIGGNGNDGIVFEVVATEDIVIRGFETLIAGAGFVAVYYHIGPYAGTTTNPGAWTLIDSVLVTGVANNTTLIPIDVDLSLVQGQMVSFLIRGEENLVGIDYTNGSAVGSVFTSDNYLQIREGEGFGNPWAGGNGLPRVYNGLINYCKASADENIFCDRIFTTDSMGNGNSGIMFDIEAKSKPVEIRSFRTYFSDVDPTNVKIFYRPGTHVGFDESETGWTLLDSVDMNITSTSALYEIPVTVDVTVPANSKMAFFLYSNNADFAYTNGNGTTVPDTIFSQNSYLIVREGSGKGSLFGPGSNNPRVFNGWIDYCVLENFTGIEETAPVTEASLYPNPSNGIFFIQLPVGDETIQQVEVMNMSGERIYVSNQVSGSNLQVDLSSSAAGIYLVRIITNKGNVTKKYIHSGR